jgi:ribokinase
VGRIVVVGSLNVDLVASVPKLPAPGETVTAVRFEIHEGGKGANQAVAASRLGADVSMVGMVGDDTYGQILLKGLAEDRIDTREVGRAQKVSTGLALIFVDAAGQNEIAVVSGANGELEPRSAAVALNRIADATVIVVQLEVPFVVVERVCSEACKHGQRIILNAAPFVPQVAGLLRQVDVLVVNEVEASALFGLAVRDHESAHLALKAAIKAGPRLTVITLGAHGAAYCEVGSEPESIPAIPVEVVDTTGAGDAFVGALAYATSREWEPREAISLGVAAGAATVMRAGAQSSLPSMTNVKQLMEPAKRTDRIA